MCGVHREDLARTAITFWRVHRGEEVGGYCSFRKANGVQPSSKLGSGGNVITWGEGLVAESTEIEGIMRRGFTRRVVGFDGFSSVRLRGLLGRLVDSLKSLDEPTSELAFATASRVEVLASAFLQIHTEVNTVGASLTSDLDRIFDQLALSDTVGELPRAPAQRMSHLPRSYATPYIAPAFKWLLKNIHNPYPSRQTKELISRGTGTSIQNVDAWFLNARRRIGWTSISKRYYNGSKIDTIAAASRALTSNSATGVADDEEYTPLPANIRMAFVEMEAAAKEIRRRQRRREEKKKQKALEKLKTELERDDKRSRMHSGGGKRRRKGIHLRHRTRVLDTEIRDAKFRGTEDEENISPPLPIAGRRRMRKI
ncbi:homeodomain mating type protein [Salix suchowensis]|nr:homeodomain mating type protein [Salix suchowensis]